MRLLFPVSSGLLDRRDVGLCQRSSFWHDHVISAFESICLMNYIYWLAYVKPSSKPWNEVNHSMGNGLFDVPLNSVCLLYREFLCTHSSGLLACSFVVMALSGSIKWVQEHSFPFFFMEQFEEIVIDIIWRSGRIQ